MRLLLDTHAFLGFVLDDPQLSSAARDAIEDEHAEVLVSPASFWEIAIKISLGNYTLTVPYQTFWERGIGDNGFHVLPIEVRHTAVLVSLPYHHRDPFDRLLVGKPWPRAHRWRAGSPSSTPTRSAGSGSSANARPNLRLAAAQERHLAIAS